MRFGSFIFPVSHDPDRDSSIIDSTLDEIELQDSLGFEAAWLTEHHFDGACAYVDPVVFGAAVASRTSNIKIGFAVVEMAFHHPVRLAAQTALLDNLSHGRLIVGIGRGSAFNTYEYLGFGISMEEGIDRLTEAEELMVESWTGEDVRHKGHYWDVSFPMLRPKPFQQPHPPLVRACISERSTREMARIGRPVLIGVQENDEIRSRIELSVVRWPMLDSTRRKLSRPSISAGFPRTCSSLRPAKRLVNSWSQASGGAQALPRGARDL